VKKWLKSEYFYGSYRNIKTGVSLLDQPTWRALRATAGVAVIDVKNVEIKI